MRIQETRSEQTQLLDEVYHDYGGGILAKSIEATVDPGTKKEPLWSNLVRGSAAEVDRQLFEAQDTTRSRGERVVAESESARQFFRRADVRDHSKRVQHLGILQKRKERLGRRL